MSILFIFMVLYAIFVVISVISLVIPVSSVISVNRHTGFLAAMLNGAHICHCPLSSCRHRLVTGAEGTLGAGCPFIHVIDPSLNLIGSDTAISPGSVTSSGLTNGLVISNCSADALWWNEYAFLEMEVETDQ